MNKEEIEKAKEYLKQQEEEETKEDLRTLYKILKNEHREGILTIERGLKYISKLELEIASYKILHEHDVNMIDEVKGNAVKWSKEKDNLKVILDKVTDKLKEVDKKYKNEYENIENMELSATKICVLQELTCVIEDIEEILNIIEGEKK